jgi:protein TonB
MTSTPRRLALWGASILIVLAIHLGLFVWSQYWRPAPAPVELPPAAMLIELEPLAAAPKPAPPPPQVVEPDEPEPEPKLVEAPKPKLVLAIPKPKPKPKPKPQPPKPPQPKPQEPSPEPPSEKPAPPAPAAPPAAQSQAAEKSAISGPSKAEVSWQGRLLGHLAHYKRYPDDARRRGQQGTVKLRFTVDANGRVLSYSIVGRSGSASLDRATQQMIRRAQPLPAPPADLLRNGSVEVVAPFIYSLDRH